MKKKTSIFLIMAMTIIPSYGNKFYTIQPEEIKKHKNEDYISNYELFAKDEEINLLDSICEEELRINEDSIEDDLQNEYVRSKFLTMSAIKNKKYKKKMSGRKLTIQNLYEEIKKNNIQYPEIVICQAILETGWFTSPVCRNKHNLFGLTNPRTGQYYEFNHWTESVKAYYTKVQYRYKTGNYLQWLKRIGYAEDPRYTDVLSKMLNRYFKVK